MNSGGGGGRGGPGIDRYVDPAQRNRLSVATLESSGAALRRVARRDERGADDADDALQRAAEILLTKAPPLG